MGLPNIVVRFITAAQTAIQRSQRGIVALVLEDTTKTDKNLYEYKTLDEVQKEDWTAANYQALTDAFMDGPNKVYAIRLGADETFADAKAVLDSLKINWLAYIGETQTEVPKYVKERNEKNGSYAMKAVVHKMTADDMHVVNFTNDSVTRKDTEDGAATAGYLYLGRIAGLLAALPMDRSCTYYVMSDLASVEEVDDPDTASDAGEFVLVNDYGTVKVARGVNSATTVEKEDLKKITIVEGMDLVREDIIETFKNYYVGKYKNNTDNQMVFIAAVNNYFRVLMQDQVLNPDFANIAEINVAAQRRAWVDAGTAEALDWDDAKVKEMPFRSNVYVKANAMFSDAIEDLDFEIYLN